MPGLQNQNFNIPTKKQQYIAQLKNEVINAQGEVEHNQAIVNSLTVTSFKFQEYLSIAEAAKSQTGKITSILEEAIGQVVQLVNGTKDTMHQGSLANTRLEQVMKEIDTIMNQSIYVADVINKLSNTIIRKKASNPLISEDLVQIASKASESANNAVALCLVALNSAYTCHSTSLTVKDMATLEYSQSTTLLSSLTGISMSDPTNKLQLNHIKKEIEAAGDDNHSLARLIMISGKESSIEYERMEKASSNINMELNEATANLEKARARLQSLQAALAAAEAATMAS